MTAQHDCHHCGKPMEIKSLEPDERRPLKKEDGKGIYILYKCNSEDCGAEREIFRSLISS